MNADSPPLNAHPATQLWSVERDNNPLRRLGHVSPFTGKLGALDSDALDQIGHLARFALPELPDPTLVIGMTESSLLLAFFMALWQQKPVDLRFTSRKLRQGEEKRAFLEPHSHGPQHYLALAAGSHYTQTVVIEDELTTGATLRNLLLTIADVAPRAFVATLRDLRPPDLREALQSEMKNAGVQLEVLSLETVLWQEHEEIASVRPIFNPFGRREDDRCAALEKLRRDYESFAPGTIYMIGECVDIALQFWLQLPPESRPELRQITRSPWKVDGRLIRSAQLFPDGDDGSRYFLYNFVPPANRRALWIGEASNACVGAQATGFLKSRGVETIGIEVAGE